MSEEQSMSVEREETAGRNPEASSRQEDEDVNNDGVENESVSAVSEKDGEKDGAQPADEAGEGQVIESPAEVIARLESELVEANTRAAEYLDRMQRSAAEFQNVRKRQEKQLYESIGRATESLIRKLLPVLDDFELAFKNRPESLKGEEEAWIEGFEKIHQKLLTVLSEEGIEPIDSSGLFDPSLHEAVTLEPNDSVESGHVIETLRTGYLHRQAVLRPALVRVAQ